MNRQQRYAAVLDYFRTNNPNAQTELTYRDPFSLLVAVILSAQCTDRRVNLVTPDLLAAYPTAERMAEAEDYEIYEYIKSVSYPNSKAQHLVGMARQLVERHGGKVPDDYDALLALPGVGRKTANVISSIVWDKPTMAVDTHVFRVAERIGLTTGSKSPLQTERTLTAHIPPSDIPSAHHWLILHGRYVCTARSPKCDECGITALCRYYSRKHHTNEK